MAFSYQIIHQCYISRKLSLKNFVAPTQCKIAFIISPLNTATVDNKKNKKKKRKSFIISLFCKRKKKKENFRKKQRVGKKRKKEQCINNKRFY